MTDKLPTQIVSFMRSLKMSQLKELENRLGLPMAKWDDANELDVLTGLYWAAMNRNGNTMTWEEAEDADMNAVSTVLASVTKIANPLADVADPKAGSATTTSRTGASSRASRRKPTGT